MSGAGKGPGIAQGHAARSIRTLPARVCAYAGIDRSNPAFGGMRGAGFSTPAATGELDVLLQDQ
jgi:hypothetical protein